MPDKLRAVEQLAKLCGWNKPEKFEHGASDALTQFLKIDWEGRRQVLGVEMANRESSTSWKDFLLALKTRGPTG